jgi:hypothetical protein
VLNLMSIFRYLARTTVSIQARGKCSYFVTKTVFKVRSCQNLVQPPRWRTNCCRRLLISYIRSYPLYWRPFLYPQDAPCRGDWDPLTTERYKQQNN